MLISADGSLEPIEAPLDRSSGRELMVTGERLTFDAGGIYLVDADETAWRISTGQLVASTRTALMVRECDEQRVCSYVLIDVASGDRRAAEVGDPDAFTRLTGGNSVLAPDASAAVMSQWRDGSFIVIDLDNGSLVTRSERIEQASWAADSSGFFTVLDSSIVFIDRFTGSTTVVPLELAEGDRVVDVRARPTSPAS